MSVQIRELNGIRTLVVLERWRPELLDEVRASGVNGLSLRLTAEQHVDFLQGVPDLELLVLSAGPQIRDLSAISELRCLRRLSLNLPARPTLHLDLAKLPYLTDLGISWNPGFASVFEAEGLRCLNVGNPPDSDLRRFADLSRLTSLTVGGGRRLRTTAGIERVTGLEILRLWQQSSLECLDGIGQLSRLRELDIETCKRLTDIDELRDLRRLRKLKLANCSEIRSLAPLFDLQELTDLYAWGSTRIVDGDLRVLLELPNLKTIAFQHRGEYQPPVDDIERHLASRHAG